MKRDKLRELGLSDEQVDQVMQLHGESVNSVKQERDTAVSERDTYKQQVDDKDATLKERDSQLEELSSKASGQDDLQQQIKDLQKKNEETQQEYENRLQQQTFDHKLEQKLKDADVHDVISTKVHLDTDKLQLDGDKILGLDDQVKQLQENKPFLFKSEEEARLAGRTPRPPGNDTKQPTGKNPFSEEHENATEQGRIIREDPEKARTLIKQAGIDPAEYGL